MSRFASLTLKLMYVTAIANHGDILRLNYINSVKYYLLHQTFRNTVVNYKYFAVYFRDNETFRTLEFKYNIRWYMCNMSHSVRVNYEHIAIYQDQHTLLKLELCFKNRRNKWIIHV